MNKHHFARKLNKPAVELWNCCILCASDWVFIMQICILEVAVMNGIRKKKDPVQYFSTLKFLQY